MRGAGESLEGEAERSSGASLHGSICHLSSVLNLQVVCHGSWQVTSADSDTTTSTLAPLS
jgi:hypothetical protein